MELPVFPLQTVLFPNTPLSLHVFEPRYLAMVDRCLRSDAPFGVALIRRGVEALGPLPEPHSVGCTARIDQVRRLADGRMNVAAVGMERFRIESLSRDEQYLVADVTQLPLRIGAPPEVGAAERRLRRAVSRYLAVVAAATETRADLSPGNLPDDAAALANVAASLLPAPLAEKQRLLALDDLEALLAETGRLYEYELPILRTLLAQPTGGWDGAFSPN
jgi:Lon protease-like protein